MQCNIVQQGHVSTALKDRMAVSRQHTQAWRINVNFHSIYKLRRRVAEPGTIITPPPASPKEAADGQRSRRQRHIDSRSERGSSSQEPSNDSEEPHELEFNSGRCVFCNEILQAPEENTAHMKKHHGFVVPYEDHLVVGVATILAYCHFIVFRYRQCILCDARRSTVGGIQQHMAAKGHCRFDITEDTVEFYDLHTLQHAHASNLFTVESGPLRLSSGKLLAHRTLGTPQTMPRAQRKATSRPKTEPRLPSRTANTCTEIATNTASEEGIPNASTGLLGLRASDQRNLAHLPLNEMRTLIAMGVKYKDQARRAVNRARSKLDRAANTNLFEFYRPDGPDRMKRGWSGGG